MGLPQEVRSNFNALLNSGNIRYQAWPDAAVGAAVINEVGNGAWVWSTVDQPIIAITNIAEPCWLVGVTILQCTWAAPATYGDLALGIGVAGAEVWLAVIPLGGAVTAAPAQGGDRWLPYPIRITGRPRVGARIRNSTGGLVTGVTVKITTATAIGT